MPEAHAAASTALVSSHDHLVEVTESLSPSEIAGPSYCKDWNVAQVLSHLGSGAEIALLMLNAALAHEPAPSRDLYQAIWDRWNALSDADKASSAITADTAYVEALQSADDAALSSISIEAFDRKLDAAGLIGMRLGEHAIHTWDVEVMKDQSAPVLSATTAILVDRLPAMAGRLARGERPADATLIAIVTTGDDRSFVLDLTGESPTLVPGTSEAEATLSLPSEALIRLVYGRLDEAHTPSDVAASRPAIIDELRALYPGF